LEKKSDAVQAMERFEEVGERQVEVFAGSMTEQYAGVLWEWIPNITESALRIADGSGNVGASAVPLLREIPNTVVFCKTVTGEICGGYMLPKWESMRDARRAAISDAAKSSFIFALVNRELATPIRFGFVGGPGSRVGYLGDYGFFFDASDGWALGLTKHGAMADGGGNWESVPGGISTLVGKLGRFDGWVQIAEWEVWKLEIG
jgi:hypothetical protein